MNHNTLGLWAYSIVGALGGAGIACGSSTALAGHAIKEIWYQTQGGESRARPAIEGDLVFFGTGNGQVVARNVSTGVPVWATPISSEAVSGANLLTKAGVVIA